MTKSEIEIKLKILVECDGEKLDEWMKHSYTVATNIVYLLPLPKLFNSARRLQTICELGGMREVLVVTVGRKLGFPWGYACGAVHFETGYSGPCKITPMK
jgi:hypothetical protein